MVAAVSDPDEGAILYKTTATDAYDPVFVDLGTCFWSADPTVAAMLDGHGVHRASAPDQAVRLAVAVIAETTRVCSAVGGAPNVAVVSARGVERLDDGRVTMLVNEWTASIGAFLERPV
jgi:hypothetical protein